MEVFRRDDYFAVVGTLHDERPWATGATVRATSTSWTWAWWSGCPT
jgi:hypothetical protein